jgi:hypothetical protein
MPRRVRVAPLLWLALTAAGCKKESPATAPYLLTTARDGEAQRVEVRTSGDFHVNDDYPVSFQPEDGGRLQLKDHVQKTACPGEATFHCTAQVNVPNQTGTLAFSVCSRENCLIEKVAIKALP